MRELTIIRDAWHDPSAGAHEKIKLAAPRATLAKRRWRGTAENGREFGFDLVHALGPGTLFHAEGDVHYYLAQEPEELLEISLGSPEQSARVGWALGNLHFPVQVLGHAVRVSNDIAVRQFLEREHIAYAKIIDVFLPLAGEISRHHHD